MLARPSKENGELVLEGCKRSHSNAAVGLSQVRRELVLSWLKPRCRRLAMSEDAEIAERARKRKEDRYENFGAEIKYLEFKFYHLPPILATATRLAIFPSFGLSVFLAPTRPVVFCV